MELLLSSDVSVHIINSLTIDSLIFLSETRKNMKNLLLEKINEHIISCGLLIEYVALISEKKYTIYSKYLVESELNQALSLTENIYFKGTNKISIIQTLLSFISLRR